jgi:hypothetical protein
MLKLDCVGVQLQQVAQQEHQKQHRISFALYSINMIQKQKKLNKTTGAQEHASKALERQSASTS